MRQKKYTKCVTIHTETKAWVEYSMKKRMQIIDEKQPHMNLKKGKLYLLAGRPGMGKAWVSFNIMHSLGMNEGQSSLYLGNPAIYDFLRMNSKTELMYLSVQGEQNEATDLIINKRHANEHATLWFYEFTSTSIEVLCAQLRQKIQKRDIRFVVINHFHDLCTKRKFRRTGKKNQYIIDQLKLLSQDKNIPILILFQVKKTVERIKNHRPRLRDIRDFKAVRSSVEESYLLYRDEYYNFETNTPNIVEITSIHNKSGKRSTEYIRCDLSQHMLCDFKISIR